MSIYINGFRLVETTGMTKKVQRRVHRKRRINKKWKKRYGCKEVVDDCALVVGCGCIFASPKMATRIIKEMKRRGESL